MTGSWGASLWTHFWTFPHNFKIKTKNYSQLYQWIFSIYWEYIGRHHNESWEQEQNVTCRIFATKTGQRLCKPLKISSFSWFLIDFNEFWNKISISFIIEYKQYRFFQYRGHKLTKKYLKIFLTCGLHPTCSRMFYKNPYRKK